MKGNITNDIGTVLKIFEKLDRYTQLGKKSNSVIRSRSVMVKNWCNVLSMEGVTVCGHHPECRVTFGRGGPHTVW